MSMILTSGMCMGMARLPMWRQEWLFWRIGLGSSTAWKIFRGISVWPLGAKTADGREAAGDAVTLLCPLWVKHKKGQEEKVFLVLFLYLRPPSSHTWAFLCTQDELGQVQKLN